MTFPEYPNDLYQVMVTGKPRFYVADCASHKDARLKARLVLGAEAENESVGAVKVPEYIATMHAATSTFDEDEPWPKITELLTTPSIFDKPYEDIKREVILVLAEITQEAAERLNL